MLGHLNDIPLGKTYYVHRISGCNAKFSRLGLIPGTAVVKVGVSPMGDPCAYRIRGAVIALRNSDCKNVLVGCE